MCSCGAASEIMIIWMVSGVISALGMMYFVLSTSRHGNVVQLMCSLVLMENPQVKLR